MISEICPKSYQKYVSLPIFGPVIDQFTIWAREKGYAICMIRKHLRSICTIEIFMNARGAQELQDLSYDDFEEVWAHFHATRDRICGTIHMIESFLAESYGLDPSPAPLSPICCELDRFASHLRNVRGLAGSTINGHVTRLKDFLKYVGYDENPEVLATLTLRQVDGYLKERALMLQRSSLQVSTVCLRAFFRFQHEQGVISSPLHAMIDSPRIYQYERLPRVLPWETVLALLASIDRSDPHGMRNYTMLLMLAAYGLRSSELVALTLDDIDWRNEAIRVYQQKSGNHLVLPLTDEVGCALLEYLEKARPRLDYRELFLRRKAPHGPLKRTAIRSIFNHCVSQSGLDIAITSPHCIRHSFAVHMQREGATLKTIGDLLGHKNAQSTCTYLRLATEDLRGVALPVPEGPAVAGPLDLVPFRSKPKNKCEKKQQGVPHLKSFLAGDIENFVNLKHSLGFQFRFGERSLRMLDAFLTENHPLSNDLTAEIFNRWCSTMTDLSLATRNMYMRAVRNLCLYRRRFDEDAFVPNKWTLPDDNHQFVPFIFSEADVARILSATRFLEPNCKSPLRAQTIRIGVLLMYTTGMRCGELVSLKLGDFNSSEGTLLIRNAKFHKTRVIPMSSSVISEVDEYLDLRRKRRLPLEMSSPLMLSGCGTCEGSAYTKSGLRQTWIAVCAAIGIFTPQGKVPRMHDLRHSFAVNALKRWYEEGVDTGTRLPVLSTYMGHVRISSTHYYISFIEGIKADASTRFHNEFGAAVTCETRDLAYDYSKDPETGGVR